MTKAEITLQLELHYNSFLDYLKELSEKEYQYSYQHKWTAGQQLEHIVKSVEPLVKLYSMSPAAIEQMFGKTNQPNQSYEQLTATYKEKLAVGGKAPSRFLPVPNTFDQRADLLKTLHQLVHQLKLIILSTKEEDLETLLIPHPLLGKISLKEMLYNAIYHVQHHHQQTIDYLQKQELKYHLAEINIARMKGITIDDPIMKEFADNLDAINQLAESSEGFVWRLKDEENNATSFNPYDDEQVIINISVWESVEALKQYVFKTHHADFMKRRKEWFQKFGKAYFAMWWVKAGTVPTLEEAVAKLDDLQKNGASEAVFNFKDLYPAPNSQ